MRRPAKFGKNQSSAGDIKDFSKYEMAAALPFWSKSVDWFKRYGNIQYIGHVDPILKIAQKCYNDPILHQFGENLE